MEHLSHSDRFMSLSLSLPSDMMNTKEKLKIYKKESRENFSRNTESLSLFMTEHVEKYVEQMEGDMHRKKECKSWIMVILNLFTLRECNDEKCKRKDVLLKMCGRCKAVFYCSRKHQKRDWKRHEILCFEANDYRV